MKFTICPTAYWQAFRTVTTLSQREDQEFADYGHLYRAARCKSH